MISVGNFHFDNCRRAKSCSLSSRTGGDVERDEKSAVHFSSNKNFRAQFNYDSDGREPQIHNQSDGKGKSQRFLSGPDRRVIDRSTFGKLKSKAVVVTAEDRRKMAEDLMADRERLENESSARKQKLQSYDALRTKGKRLAQVYMKENKISMFLKIIIFIKLFSTFKMNNITFVKNAKYISIWVAN